MLAIRYYTLYVNKFIFVCLISQSEHYKILFLRVLLNMYCTKQSFGGTYFSVNGTLITRLEAAQTNIVPVCSSHDTISN